MQVLTLVFGLVWFVPALVLAAPAPQTPTRSLEKRAPVSPVIASGFTAQETQQLEAGIADAMQLAAYIRSSPSAVDPIVGNYFDTTDRKRVDNVFDAILGGDPRNPPGNPLLADITIVPDFKDNKYDLACKRGVMAALRYPDTAQPKMVICAGAGFGHKGIDEIDCATTRLNGGRVSWRMETLGSIILHEYTHFEKLMKRKNQRGKVDVPNGYGPVATRKLSAGDAIRNSDSYSWLANENLWTMLCKGGYGAPEAGDDEDENCDNEVCVA